MSEQTLNPLQEAQHLIVELRQKAETLTLAALKERLSALDDLLNKAAAPVSAENHTPAKVEPSPGDEAAALRNELNSFIDRNASFTSLMVHEIRKPMTTIRGYSDMLAKPGMIGQLNEMQQQFIDTIRASVIRMEGLVSDISDMNKLTSGRLRLDNKMTIFSQVILEVQKTVEPLIGPSGHTVTWEVPQGLPILNADNKQLAKVIISLVKNALQYTPTTPSGGQIIIKGERLDGNKLRISVSDTGIGMKPDEIARLGEPFYHADHELVTSQKGYGLGIPVAMGFLKLMDSALTTESEPGKGSTFSFTLVGMG